MTAPRNWTEEALLEARDSREDWLMSHDFVIGSGVGFDRHGNLCVKIMTDNASAADRMAITAYFEGVPLLFEQTGPMTAL